MPEPVAFDAGQATAQPTGVGIYVRELARSLKALGTVNLRVIGARADGPLADDAATTMRRDRHLAWIVRDADRDARESGARLTHYTNAVAPPRTSMPFVLTIQDLSLIRFPHYHPAQRLAVIPFMAWAAQRARRVITPSRATADEIRRLLRVSPARLSVVELAPVPSEVPTDAERASVLRELSLDDRRFLLCLGTLEPRKNVVNAVRAFETLVVAEPDLLLVLAGGRGWRTGSIDRAIRESSSADRIVRVGYVDDLTRRALLDACVAFVYVSLYEGYGLPIVEAMAAGAPVVTSNVSSMPEAASDAAVLVDPRDVRSIADGIARALTDSEALRNAGRRRAGQLSWERVARETGEVYEAVANRWV